MFNVAFRVDASVEIGTGHVMRCITLADALKKKDIKSHFIMRKQYGDMANYTKNFGHEVTLLPNKDKSSSSVGNDVLEKYSSWLGANWIEDAEEVISIVKNYNISWIITDHYGIDERWEKRVKQELDINIMIIDGLANRKHKCDALLDQSYSEDGVGRWSKLVPSTCKMFIGPEYAFLRPEFFEQSSNIKKRGGIVKRIFISFGGIDKSNVTQKALEAVINNNYNDIAIDVVVGKEFQYKDELERYRKEFPQVTLHVQPSKIAELMSNADLAIGAGGTMMWERYFLGLPSLVISIADNQVEQTVSANAIGVIYYLGAFEKNIKEKLQAALLLFMSNPEMLISMSIATLNLMKTKEISNNFEFDHPVVDFIASRKN